MSLRAGVVGWPIAHSLSPRIHGFWLAEHSVDGSYEAVPVPPDGLAEAVARFRAEGWRGFNVTVPHKEAIIPLIDRLDPFAERIGAVNTVVALADGRLDGRNSDAPGFLASLGPIALDRPVVMLGAGGAARAILAALAGAGATEIRIVNRNRSRAEALASAIPAIVGDWESRAALLDGAGLLVNTTSLGMAGQPPLGLDLAALPRDAVVTDIVYRPLETGLLAAACARGNPTVDGLGMLLHQAVMGFAAWFGVVPQVTEALRAHVLAALEPAS
jgi:shikimate dehydrogenase